MAYKLGGNALFQQQAGFKRQQAQDLVAAAPDAPRPTRAPGPYGGAYVLHGAHALPLHAPGQAEVELRGIHSYKHVRAKLGKLP